nr:MAG TPA: head closure knob [Caudoviricetes sp.]
MRESERVELVFQAEKPKYDPELGRMSNAEPTKKVFPCFISELGLELKVKLLDKIDVDAKILRFNHVINGSISSVIIAGKRYKVISRKTPERRSTVLYVAEVIG